MSTTNRMYPPGGAATTTTFVSPVGNPTVVNPPGLVSYTAGANASVDAAYAGVSGLAADGWVQPENLVGSGATGARPSAVGYKFKFFLDTTLAAFIWSDGTIWRTAAGAAA